MIRDTLGDDAVIISSVREGEGKGISVTAAVDDAFSDEMLHEEAQAAADAETMDMQPAPEPQPDVQVEPATQPEWEAPEHTLAKHYASSPLFRQTSALHNRDLVYLLNEFEKTLNFHNAPAELTDKVLRAARHVAFEEPKTPEAVHSGFSDLLSFLFKFEPLVLEYKPERIMLVGPPGVGKTLAVAKLAAHLAADKMPVHVLTIDNKRAGSVEQLRAFTSIMGLETEVADTRNDLRQQLKDIPETEPVIIDSFATNPYSFDDLRELNEFASLNEIEPVLVLSAGGDPSEAAEITRAFSFLGIKRLLASRLDTARHYGALLAAADANDLALCQMTDSPQVAGGLRSLHAATLADLLMEYKYDH